MSLEPLEIVSGCLSIAAISLATLIGLIIMSKYFKYKRRVFLLVGITAILLVEPWWPSAISFLIAITHNNNGLQDYPEMYFIIGNVLIPISIVTWLIAFTDLLYEKQQKILVTLGIIYGVVFEIIFFYFLYTDSTLIGTLNGPLDVEYHHFIMGFLLSVVIFVLTTGLLFAKDSLRSDIPEIRLKGKLLVFSFVSFTVGAILDAFLTLTIIALVITRFFLMACAIGFYGGFILPDWMKKIFLKGE